LLIPKGTLQFKGDGALRFIYVVIFSQKYDSQYATELPAFKFATIIVFKYETQHAEVIYAHQASIFRAIEARGKRIFQPFPPFCFKRSKQAVYA